MCGWVPRFFHVFGVFLICRSVQTGCVLEFLQDKKQTQLGLGHYLFPICSYSMKSCTWPFCSNKCAIFINCFWHLFHFILHCPYSSDSLLSVKPHLYFIFQVGGIDSLTNKTYKKKKILTKTNWKAKHMIDQGRDALNENGTGCMQNKKKTV